MPSAPPPGTPIWTLNAANISGGSYGDKLAGCHIWQDTNNYRFTKPDWTVLASSPGTTLPTAAFTFTPAFTHGNVSGQSITGWSISMSAPPTDTTQNWGTDGWLFPDQPSLEEVPISGQSGEFTAQAGSGPMPAEEEASSATA